MDVELADIAVVGLAVMGQNLILNMDEQGYVVCAYNRTKSRITDFLANEAKGTSVIGAHSPEEVARKLKKPRRILLLVKAGDAVDQMIEQFLPFMEKGDILIDGGNSSYHDTERRFDELSKKGIHFVGMGISGGEEGARHGPSLMPGGAPEAWPHLKELFTKICAKVGCECCCDWMGSGGSGHFVKMVHNGIEYGDMQLIAEAYHLLKDAVGLDHDEMAEVFDRWNKGELDSFLIKITADILRFRDSDNEYLVPKILDTAGQKGTGKWTSIIALDHGIPVTLIAEAVFARFLSALKKERQDASKILRPPKPNAREFTREEKDIYIENIRQALYASKIISYAQGFMLLEEASQYFGWNLNHKSIALVWRNGCIIRSRFLENIRNAFDTQPPPPNLLLDPFFYKAIDSCQEAWRIVCANAALLGIPVPAFSSALSFYDGYRCDRLPSNLIQAQRDYFGAHTYELVSNTGKAIHTNWTGTGGRVTAHPYDA